MRVPLRDLQGRSFDVAVIGAGVNGASAAQHLASAGYSVLLVERGDFASGSSSRSGRLLHCGLRYFASGNSPWGLLKRPKQFITACRMARAAMESRADFVQATPERVEPVKMCYPFFRDTPYAGWQIDAAFRLLKGLGPAEPSLDYSRLSRTEARKTPLLDRLRAPDELKHVAMFREYKFDWPERIVIDTVLDAERLGAVVRNYTPVTRMERRSDDGWAVTLGSAPEADSPEEYGEATVTAQAVFNMAGIWIDAVNGTVRNANPQRRITGTKGVHIAVQLPPDCAEYGLLTLNRLTEPLYGVPWRGLHYFGPTETLYDGDIDGIVPTEEEILFLLGEVNHLLPSLALTRDDVRYAWAGVRPLTYDPTQPMGARSRELHDLTGDGMPGVFAMTAGPIGTHRSAGEESLAAMHKLAPPRRAAQSLSFDAAPIPADPKSPRLSNAPDAIREADVRRAIEREHARTLVDVLFRRTMAGWSADMGRAVAPSVARQLAEALGWSEERVTRELADFNVYLRNQHAVDAHGGSPSRTEAAE